jgi:hypothetical protein
MGPSYSAPLWPLLFPDWPPSWPSFMALTSTTTIYSLASSSCMAAVRSSIIMLTLIYTPYISL